MDRLTLIFDVGKTNKKCYLLDEDFGVVENRAASLPTTVDGDRYPCEDLDELCYWIESQIKDCLSIYGSRITRLNFSSYGASLVHLDDLGKPLTPLYDYTKPLDEALTDGFYAAHGGEAELSRKTASPPSGMLNSGLQLYWLKQKRPQIFNQIVTSLHLPQYLSYLYTGKLVSDYTSVGCHTSLWDFDEGDYHRWVEQESCLSKLAPMVSTSTSYQCDVYGHMLDVGVGIHDSSASLLPYLLAEKSAFVLVSSGTWTVTLLPKVTRVLEPADLELNCLHYMQPTGEAVRACRLFFGREYDYQLDRLADHFELHSSIHKLQTLDEDLLLSAQNTPFCYRFDHLDWPRSQPEETDYTSFRSFEQGYHQLMHELMDIQCQAIRQCVQDSPIKKIYIDGGFAQNQLFVTMLARAFPEVKIRMTHSPMGSALGAALVMDDQEIGKKFLKRNYAMKKYKRKAVAS